LAETLRVTVAGNPTFTADWFSRQIPMWESTLAALRGQPISILEIGSYEGRSATFLLGYLPESHITCIDIFAGDYEAKFDANMASFQGRLRKIKNRSALALDMLMTEGRQFDLIYIDGSHERQDTFTDSVMAWPLLSIGGILIWDDWRWNLDGPSEHRPQHAIDLFCVAFSPCLKELHRDYQVMVRKTSEWPELRLPRLRYALRRRAARTLRRLHIA